jgi:hypothetical protein
VAGSAARAAGRNRSVVASASEESLRFTKVWLRGMPRCLLGRDGYSSCVLRPWVRSPCSSSNTSGHTDSDCLPAGRGIMDSSNECVAAVLVLVDGVQKRQVREKAAEGLCGKSNSASMLLALARPGIRRRASRTGHGVICKPAKSAIDVARARQSGHEPGQSA